MLKDKNVELTVPSATSLGDVLPVALGRFGPDRVEEGIEHEGWLARGADGAVLDEERTPAELALVDGAVVNLCPRALDLAPIDYDDVVDGVGEQVRNDPSSWSPRASKTMLLAVSAVAMLAGLAVLLDVGNTAMTAGLAGGMALVLLAGAGLAARAVADAVIGTVLAGIAAAHAAVACWLAVGAIVPEAPWPVRLAVAGGGVLVVLCLGVVVVADGAALFASAFMAVLLITAAAVVTVTTGLSATAAATAALVAIVLAMYAVAPLARVLGRLPLPLVPAAVSPTADPEADDGQDTAAASDEEKPAAPSAESTDEPATADLVVDRRHAAAVYECALYTGIGLASVAFVLVLFEAGGLLAAASCGLFAMAVSARARRLGGAGQRSAVLASGGVAALSAVSLAAFGLPPELRLPVVWLPAALVAAGLFLAAESVARPRSAGWRRVIDIGGHLAAAGLVTALAAVLTGGRLP